MFSHARFIASHLPLKFWRQKKISTFMAVETCIPWKGADQLRGDYLAFIIAVASPPPHPPCEHLLLRACRNNCLFLESICVRRSMAAILLINETAWVDNWRKSDSHVLTLWRWVSPQVAGAGGRGGERGGGKGGKSKTWETGGKESRSRFKEGKNLCLRLLFDITKASKLLFEYSWWYRDY